MQMFGQITEQFQTIFKNIRGLGKITDKNINDSVRQVGRDLIDAAHALPFIIMPTKGPNMQ